MLLTEVNSWQNILNKLQVGPIIFRLDFTLMNNRGFIGTYVTTGPGKCRLVCHPS